MLTQLRIALVALLGLTLLTGVVYPLAVTAVSWTVFARQAQGTLIVHEGKVLGSRLIGQPFADPKYFWGRLSATSPSPYNGGSSSGSNLGPTNPTLFDAVRGRVDALREADPQNGAPIPIDLVTASGSGLDPDLSPAAALYQVARVARVRHLDEGRLRALVAVHTKGRDLGVLGEPRVNVLELNLALDGIE